MPFSYVDTTWTTMPIESWPAEDLEAVSVCPACGYGPRQLLYAALTDRVFFSAPGQWSLYACKRCGVAFLDPRPTQPSIGRAYRTYYTHSALTSDPTRSSSLSLKWKMLLRNDYLNHAFGYRLCPALPAGRHLLSQRRQRQYGRWVRHLQLPAGRPALLDVGCGNGKFLAQMTFLGWHARGIEPDPIAAAAARDSGLDVQEGFLTEATAEAGRFDAATLSHVIEHVHSPTEMLALCHRCLRPGGVLWIGTPNVDALGHQRFGASWRGLEPPRHLTLFNTTTLTRLLLDAGFADVLQPAPDSVGEWFHLASAAMSHGLDPEKWADLPREVQAKERAAAREAHARTTTEPHRTEELVLMVRKPGPSVCAA